MCLYLLDCLSALDLCSKRVSFTPRRTGIQNRFFGKAGKVNQDDLRSVDEYTHLSEKCKKVGKIGINL